MEIPRIFIGDLAANLDRAEANLRHWRQECGKLHSQIKKLNAEKEALRKSLENARSLVIRHHDCGVRIRAGMFCPVCSPDGRDTEFDAAFGSLYCQPQY